MITVETRTAIGRLMIDNLSAHFVARVPTSTEPRTLRCGTR
jgi:hypothetical protein